MPFVSIIKGRLFVYHPQGETKMQSLNQGPFSLNFDDLPQLLYQKGLPPKLAIILED